MDAETLATDVDAVEEMREPSLSVVSGNGGFLVALDGEDDGRALHSEAGAHEQFGGGEVLLQIAELRFFFGSQRGRLPEFSPEIHCGEGFGWYAQFRNHAVARGAGEETEELLGAGEDEAAEAWVEEEAAIDEVHEVGGGTGVARLATRSEAAEREQPAVVELFTGSEVESEGPVGTGAVVDLVLFGADVFPFVRDVISDGEHRSRKGSRSDIGNTDRNDSNRNRRSSSGIGIGESSIFVSRERQRQRWRKDDRCRRKKRRSRKNCVWRKRNEIRIDRDDRSKFGEDFAVRTGASVFAVAADGAVEVEREIGESVIGRIDDTLGGEDAGVTNVRGRQCAERLARRHLLTEMRSGMTHIGFEIMWNAENGL